MKKAAHRPLTIGDLVPDVSGRTDEGTPISVVDFEGRAIAYFLLGSGLGDSQQKIMSDLKDRIDVFLSFDYSPVVISSDPDVTLQAYREMEDLPFLLISDESGAIHISFSGKNIVDLAGTWLVNDERQVVSVVPPLNPAEQVSASIAALMRVCRISIH